MEFEQTENPIATFGEKSNSVLNLQKQLNSLGANIKEDSMFGPLTKSAQDKFGSEIEAPEEDVYTSTVKDELSDFDETPGGDSFGLDKARTDFDTYKTNRENSFKELQGLRSSAYDKEYTDRDLGTQKTKISSLDSDIAREKQLRDEELFKIRSNRGLSASQMTGDIKKVADFQNNVINNLIAERNGVSELYNNSLGEIHTVVENSLADKTLDYQYWDDLANEADASINEYSKIYREELAGKQTQDNFERKLEQALKIATEPGGGSGTRLQLVKDTFGDAVATFNPSTGQITPLNPDSSGTKPDDPFADTEDIEVEEKGPGFFKRLLNLFKGKK